MLQILPAVSSRIGQGKPVAAEHLAGIIEFLTVFVDKCHHGKEEEFLFPALEAAGVPREGGPIGVMLNEHQQGRTLAAQFKEALTRLSSGDKRAAADVPRIVRQYVDLLTRHIEKENQVLFAMADARLDANKDSELFDAFEQLEKERIGAGKHEEFHALLDRLQDAYLNRNSER
jgi:hemerythrin-like domain-containing protein